MIFELKTKKDKFIEDCYKKAMKELGEFYGINWVRNTPNILVWKDRKVINQFKKEKTENWFVGEARGFDIFLLDRKDYEKESSHKYSDERYCQLIKHELSHLFFGILSGGETPYWLNEGITLYSAGQTKKFPRINRFNTFLKYYDRSGGKTYFYESGFFIELLIKKFGKQKILKLIKNLKNINSEKEFKQLFKKIYSFNLNYKEINKLYKQK